MGLGFAGSFHFPQLDPKLASIPSRYTGPENIVVWGTYSSWGGPAEIERKHTLYYVEKLNGPFWYSLARQLTDFGNDGVFIKLQKNETVEIEF